MDTLSELRKWDRLDTTFHDWRKKMRMGRQGRQGKASRSLTGGMNLWNGNKPTEMKMKKELTILLPSLTQIHNGARSRFLFAITFIIFVRTSNLSSIY